MAFALIAPFHIFFQSIKNKFTESAAIVHEQQSSITESWCNLLILDAKVRLENYKVALSETQREWQLWWCVSIFLSHCLLAALIVYCRTLF